MDCTPDHACDSTPEAHGLTLATGVGGGTFFVPHRVAPKTEYPWLCENGHVFGDGNYGVCPECKTFHTRPLPRIAWRASDQD